MIEQGHPVTEVAHRLGHSSPTLSVYSHMRLDRVLVPFMVAQGSGVVVHVTSIQHRRFVRSMRSV